MEILEILHKIQTTLKAPKSQYNSFGKYNYRSCEDILEAVKKLLPEGCAVTIKDEVEEVGGRVYIKALASLNVGEHSIRTTAYAREPETQKGMNEAQITGSASSYARKYALNGLFLIDDTKDADATNKHSENSSKPKPEIHTIENKDDPVWAKVKEAKTNIGDTLFNKAKEEIGVDRVYKVKDAKALLLAIDKIANAA